MGGDTCSVGCNGVHHVTKEEKTPAWVQRVQCFIFRNDIVLLDDAACSMFDRREKECMFGQRLGKTIAVFGKFTLSRCVAVLTAGALAHELIYFCMPRLICRVTEKRRNARLSTGSRKPKAAWFEKKKDG